LLQHHQSQQRRISEHSEWQLTSTPRGSISSSPFLNLVDETVLSNSSVLSMNVSDNDPGDTLCESLDRQPVATQSQSVLSQLAEQRSSLKQAVHVTTASQNASTSQSANVSNSTSQLSSVNQEAVHVTTASQNASTSQSANVSNSTSQQSSVNHEAVHVTTASQNASISQSANVTNSTSQQSSHGPQASNSHHEPQTSVVSTF